MIRFLIAFCRAALGRRATLRGLSADASHRRSLGPRRPLPHPATHTVRSMGGRAGERAGAASRREARN